MSDADLAVIAIGAVYAAVALYAWRLARALR